jgi:endonuclease VIII
MPEGDNIYLAAKTLNSVLAGQLVTRFDTVLPELARVEVAGRTVERVVSAGKNLIIDFSGDLHLRTHMRMHGSWHIYRPGERWRMRRDTMRIVIETDEWVAVAFNVPVAEFHDAHSLARQDDLQKIGPDLLGATFDEDEALRRLRERPGEEIGEALLNQRVVSGIGNQYKSEILFMCRISPLRHVRDLEDAALRRMLETARKIMLANVAKQGGGRVTTFSLDPRQSLYVYGRAGKPCRRCGAPIEMKRTGPNARVTFSCPRCQL